jgi:thiol-disulfide isomerase/thioredoxin
MKINEPIDENRFKVDTNYLAGTNLGPATEGLLPIGASAPEFSLKDPQGKSHRLSEYRGKVVLLDFWATWCLPCRRMMPIMQKLNDQYRGVGVVTLGIAVDPEYDAAALMKRLGHSYPLLVKGDQVAKKYRAEMLPTLYVIDQRGRIVHRQAGITKDDSTYIPALVRKTASNQPAKGS